MWALSSGRVDTHPDCQNVAYSRQNSKTLEIKAENTQRMLKDDHDYQYFNISVYIILVPLLKDVFYVTLNSDLNI